MSIRHRSLTRKRSLVQIQYGPPVQREKSNASNRPWGRLYDEVWNAQRYEAASDLFDPGFQHDAAPGIRGGAAKLAAIRGYHASCPDLHISIEDLGIGDDRIAARWTLTGTDTGDLKGRPATGRSVRAWGVEHLGLRDGKIVSDWAGADWLGILIQLGVIPNPWEH